MDKKEKIKIIIMFLFIAIILFTFVYILNKTIIEKQETKNINNKSNKIKNEKNLDKNREDKKKTIYDKNNHITYSFNNKNGNILTESIAKTIEEKTRKKILQFKFLEAHDYMADAISEYDIENSPAFKSIEGMYRDLAIICALPQVLEDGNNMQVLEMIKSLNDNENFFIISMWLDDELRKYLLCKKDSINPVFIGNIKIIEKKTINADDSKHLTDVERVIEDVQEIVKYRFEIEDNELCAYIIQAKDGFYFYKITREVEGTNYYPTVEEWEKIWKETENKSR